MNWREAYTIVSERLEKVCHEGGNLATFLERGSLRELAQVNARVSKEDIINAPLGTMWWFNALKDQYAKRADGKIEFCSTHSGEMNFFYTDADFLRTYPMNNWWRKI